MVRRFTRFAALVAVGSTVLAGCSSEQEVPVGVSTVRLAIVAGAEHGGAPFTTGMTQEVTHTPVHTGDPDGTGSALITVNRGQREVCWDVSVSNIELSPQGMLSHIHKQEPGVRGAVVVTLTPPTTGRSTGCVPVNNDALLMELIQSPESFYVNVHNMPYPGGAVRGQLGQ